MQDIKHFVFLLWTQYIREQPPLEIRRVRGFKIWLLCNLMNCCGCSYSKPMCSQSYLRYWPGAYFPINHGWALTRNNYSIPPFICFYFKLHLSPAVALTGFPLPSNPPPSLFLVVFDVLFLAFPHHPSSSFVVTFPLGALFPCSALGSQPSSLLLSKPSYEIPSALV